VTVEDFGVEAASRAGRAPAPQVNVPPFFATEKGERDPVPVAIQAVHVREHGARRARGELTFHQRLEGPLRHALRNHASGCYGLGKTVVIGDEGGAWLVFNVLPPGSSTTAVVATGISCAPIDPKP
jgi:hypothetical protein